MAMYSRKLVEYGRLSPWFMCSLFHLGFLALIHFSFPLLDIKMLNYHIQVPNTASCRWKIRSNPGTQSEAFKVAALFLCLICTSYKDCLGPTPRTEVAVGGCRSLLLWNHFDSPWPEQNLLHSAEHFLRNWEIFADQVVLWNSEVY